MTPWFGAAPDSARETRVLPASIAILGADMPGLRPNLAVRPGDAVRAGELLFTDRRRSWLRSVAPVSGTIGDIVLGPRRSFDRLVIAAGEAEPHLMSIPPALDRAALVALLLEAGLWHSLRTRPFERVPPPDAEPDALFVTAIDTRPLAADPAAVIAPRAEWFARGLDAIRLLCAGKTWLCHAAGADLPTASGVTSVGFAGGHPAGLVGTHIHRLHPVGRSGSVWHIGYQDVIAIGHLLATGRLWSRRVISAAGDGMRAPALIETTPGADLHELLRDHLLEEPLRLISGSPIDGRQARYLGRYHLQATALELPRPARTTRLSSLRDWLQRGADAIIPNAVHERAAPPGILPIPLLRALSIGDTETARRLGALELAEEDLALLTLADAGARDYGALLRHALDALEGAS